MDDTIIVRIFEYDAQIALNDGKRDGTTFTVSFPHSAVMALRHTKKTPSSMHIRVVTPSGEAGYDVPVIKVQQYSLEEIFQRKLLFFLPFYIFGHESRLQDCEDDEIELKKLTNEYIYIRSRLDDLQKTGEISEFMKSAICAMTSHVLALIAQNYQKVREGVGHIMGGKILEYEAKTIRNEERRRAQAETEERAKDMIRDRMELPLVEKYTHLSMPRIEELARGLGIL